MQTESRTGHTPGPWHYGEPVRSHGQPMVWDQDGHLVADASGHVKRSHEEAVANAVLMAQAPELLRELETLVGRIEYYASLGKSGAPNIEDWAYTEGSTDMENARAAIAKARGQGGGA